MKPLTFITNNFKNITIGILIIVLIIALNKCKGTKDKSESLAKSARELQQKVYHDSLTRAQERKRFNDEKKEVAAEKELAAIEKNEADKKVQAQQSTIDRLAATIRQSNKQPIDTTNAVLVSRAYKDACDSFPPENDKLRAQLSEKDSAINQWTDILSYEIQTRDEEIAREMAYSDSLHSAFNVQAGLLKSAISQGRPRGRLLAGLGILGNQKQFLSGFSGIIAYQTKGGKQYQVSPKFIKVPGSEAEVFYEGTVLFTIFK